MALLSDILHGLHFPQLYHLYRYLQSENAETYMFILYLFTKVLVKSLLIDHFS